MKRGYKELVGLQVTFSNVVSQYSLVHFYRWKENGVLGPVLVMRGYDMDRAEPVEGILAGLRSAYAPAVLSIWQQTTGPYDSEYLQFQVGARPDEVNLPGEWTLWAEW